jgi:hypothetical protein
VQFIDALLLTQFSFWKVKLIKIMLQFPLAGGEVNIN